jgi:hypothetical protein
MTVVSAVVDNARRDDPVPAHLTGLPRVDDAPPAARTTGTATDRRAPLRRPGVRGAPTGTPTRVAPDHAAAVPA